MNKIFYYSFTILFAIVIIFKDLYLDIEEYYYKIIINDLLINTENLMREADNDSIDID